MTTISRTILFAAALLALAPAARAADDDPLKGKFTMKEATAGLAGKGPLFATFDTSQGTITCELFEKQAPNTVANFVGLARGLRPFKNPTTGNWEKRAYYDGLKFHRVIPGFMIQGGDIEGTGRGGPGYLFDDETKSGLKFDKPGLLAMANRGQQDGHGTNGSQFFITDAPGANGFPVHLNGKHTIFGVCEPVATVTTIAQSGPGTTMNKVTISRGKPAKSDGKAKPEKK